MRKVQIEGLSNGGPSLSGFWFDLENVAVAELSSEDPQHPFEHALAGGTTGWKASSPGPQLIRLRFDSPQNVRRVRLRFQEERIERAQEFALFATAAGAQRKEIMRQQWMFSPRGNTAEVEDYFFDLRGVTVLEIEIDPGRDNKQVIATLQSIEVG
ncbi:MAG: hypothetical protein ACRYGF_04035 [Janthinobacterium lividum]